MAIQRGIRSVRLVLVIFLILAGCKFNDPQKPDTGSIQNLYKKHCSLCHGMDGKLGLAGAGDLTQSVISHEEIVTIITNGKTENPGKIMTAFKDVLSTEEIEAMATFAEGLRTQ